jgi:hypothetical protein
MAVRGTTRSAASIHSVHTVHGHRIHTVTARDSAAARQWARQDFRVESGGVGAGTITRFTVTAGGRIREYRMKVAEPEPGRILTESDTDSSAVTTFRVSPQGGASLVRISSTWDGASGIGGLFERMLAPRVMRGIYADELRRLDAYAREHRST